MEKAFQAENQLYKYIRGMNIKEQRKEWQNKQNGQIKCSVRGCDALLLPE